MHRTEPEIYIYYNSLTFYEFEAAGCELPLIFNLHITASSVLQLISNQCILDVSIRGNLSNLRQILAWQAV